MDALHFDQDYTLAGLLNGIDGTRLLRDLQCICGPAARIVDARGRVLLGCDTSPIPLRRVPLRTDLEILGYLEGLDDQDVSNLDAARDMIELLLHQSMRYQMASALHVESVQADYETLHAQYRELQSSEARYRELAASLEDKVAAQVTVIENTQRHLYQQEKLASIGQLAAGVAHEINNPIGFIRSNLSTGRDYLSQITQTLNGGREPVPSTPDMAFILDDFQALLDECISGVDRIAHIVSALKEFSRVDRSHEDLTDINEGIRAACHVAHREIAGRADLLLDLAPLPPSRCNPDRLNMVFLNLLLNAAQAITPPGTIRVSSRTEAGRILVEVRDSGCGIPADVLPRIFDPFFSTKGVGQGTGLGLSVAHDIIKAHDGLIRVESSPGHGTCFIIDLPLRA